MPVVKSTVLLSKELCCSWTLLQPYWWPNTVISHVPLPFSPTHHPPTATKAPPRRAEQQRSDLQRSCNSWKKREPALRDQPTLCRRYPAEHQWSGSNSRTLAGVLCSPGLLTAGFPHSVFAFLSAVINLANSQRALEKWWDDYFSLVATAHLLG